MTKLAFLFTVIAALTGFGLFMPASPGLWPVYSMMLVIHVVTSVSVIGLVLVVTVTHVRKMLKVAKKGQASKTSGIIYLATLFLALGTGIFMTVRSGFAVSWMVALHVVAGCWCLIFSWKHSVKTRYRLAQPHQVKDVHL